MKPLALVTAVAGAAVVTVSLTGSPASAGKSTDDGYNRSTFDAVATHVNGIRSDGGGTYVEPADALLNSWTLEAKGRPYVVTVHAGSFTCATGKIWGSTNPYVTCTTVGGDSVTLDYPPIGNATKSTMVHACGAFSDNGTTAVTTMPDPAKPDCKAAVYVKKDGVMLPTTYELVPFTMTQTKG